MLKQLIIGCCVLGLAQSAFAKMVVREITPPGTWTVKTQSSGDKTTFQIAIPFKDNVLPPGTSAQVDVLDGTNPVSTLTPQLQVMDGKSCFVFTVPTKFLPNSKFSLTIIDVPHPSGDILWMNLAKLAEHQRQTTEPVATSRTDPFLKLLRDGLDVKPATGWEPVGKAVDWDKLGQEAGKSANAPDRLATVIKRLAYVELWKRLAAAHDYGVTCSRPNVFEWLACELLAGTHKPDKALPYADLGLGKDKACEYLLAEDLPAWAASLRSCAAAVLAGAGERRGMDVLMEAVRASLKGSRGFDHPVHEAMRAAWTEEALPLWAEAARDPDPRIRLVVVQHVGAIRSGRAVPVLLAILKDEDRDVRTAAAMTLMRRDVKADAKAPVEFALVLMEKVRHELDGRILSAHNNAPVCLKLQQWGVPDVPWEKIEAVLNDQARTNDTDYWRAVEIAGWCLGAGREKIALPFLKSTINIGAEKLDQLATLGIGGQKLAIPWHAATTLAANGRTEGFDLIGRYIEVGQKNWIPAYEGLMALAAFLNRPAVAPADRKLAMAIAAKAVERRDALFQGYFWRALEALGEMGALVRVKERGPSLEAVEAIALPYDQRYSSYPKYMMAEIFRAKVRSVSSAAQQDGITLPPAWLSEYQKQERAAITALAEGTDSDLRRAAEAALKDLAASPPAE